MMGMKKYLKWKQKFLFLLKDFYFSLWRASLQGWMIKVWNWQKEKSDIHVYQYVWFDIRTLPCCSIGEMIEFSDSMASDIVILNYFFW